MSGTKTFPIIILRPLCQKAEELVRFFRKEGSCEIVEVENISDAPSIILSHQPCIVVSSITGQSELFQIIDLLKRINLKQNRDNIKTIIVGHKNFAHITEVMRTLYVSDFVVEPVATRTLIFKGRLQLNTIKAAAKKQSSASGQGATKSFEAEKAGEEEESEDNVFVFKRKKAKQIKEKFVVEVEGPSPEEGSWEPDGIEPSSGEQKWKWKPKKKKEDGKTESTDGWTTTGEKPKYNPEHKSWELTSEKPNLVLDKKGEKSAELEMNEEGELELKKKRRPQAKDKAEIGAKSAAAAEESQDPEARRRREVKEKQTSPAQSGDEENAAAAAKAATPFGKLASLLKNTTPKAEAPVKTNGLEALAKILPIRTPSPEKAAPEKKHISLEKEEAAATRAKTSSPERAAETQVQAAEKVSPDAQTAELPATTKPAASAPSKQPVKETSPAPKHAQAADEKAKPLRSGAPAEEAGAEAQLAKKLAAEKQAKRVNSLKEHLQAITEREQKARTAQREESEAAENSREKKSAAAEPDLHPKNPERKDAEDPLDALKAKIERKNAPVKDPVEEAESKLLTRKPKARPDGKLDQWKKSLAEGEEAAGPEGDAEESLASGDAPRQRKTKYADPTQAPDEKESSGDLPSLPEEDNTWSALQAGSAKATASKINAKDSDQDGEDVKWQAKNGEKTPAREIQYFYKDKSEISSLPGRWVQTDSAFFFLRDSVSRNGIGLLQEALPLWIYKGEKEPRLESPVQRWKFRDQPPILALSTNDIPPSVLDALVVYLRKEEAPAQPESVQSKELKAFFEKNGKAKEAATEAATEKKKKANSDDKLRDLQARLNAKDGKGNEEENAESLDLTRDARAPDAGEENEEGAEPDSRKTTEEDLGDDSSVRQRKRKRSADAIAELEARLNSSKKPISETSDESGEAAEAKTKKTTGAAATEDGGSTPKASLPKNSASPNPEGTESKRDSSPNEPPVAAPAAPNKFLSALSKLAKGLKNEDREESTEEVLIRKKSKGEQSGPDLADKEKKAAKNGAEEPGQPKADDQTKSAATEPADQESREESKRERDQLRARIDALAKQLESPLPNGSADQASAPAPVPSVETESAHPKTVAKNTAPANGAPARTEASPPQTTAPVTAPITSSVSAPVSEPVSAAAAPAAPRPEPALVAPALSPTPGTAAVPAPQTAMNLATALQELRQKNLAGGTKPSAGAAPISVSAPTPAPARKAAGPSLGMAAAIAKALSEGNTDKGGAPAKHFNDLAAGLAFAQIDKERMDSTRMAKILLDYCKLRLPHCRAYALEEVGSGFFKPILEEQRAPSISASHLEHFSKIHRGAVRLFRATDKQVCLWIEFGSAGETEKQIVQQIGEYYAFAPPSEMPAALRRAA